MIGGREDKIGDRTLLREVAGRARGALVVCPAATELPWLVGPDYARLFRGLGVADVRLLDLRSRADADSPGARATLEGADVLFFTGGDQRRISRFVVGSALHGPVLDLYR